MTSFVLATHNAVDNIKHLLIYTCQDDLLGPLLVIMITVLHIETMVQVVYSLLWNMP